MLEDGINLMRQGDKMRKLRFILFALISCVLLMGAAEAPVSPSKSFYVSDYANVIFREHREQISRLAAELERATGVQTVVLTVENISGMEIEAYAQAIMDGWDVGGATDEGFVLLYCDQPSQVYILVGSGLRSALTTAQSEEIQSETIAPFLSKHNYSTGIISGYKLMLGYIYTGYGIPPGEELLAIPEEAGEGGGISKMFLIFIVVALLAALRGMRVSRKYRQKYFYRHKYKRRSFTARHNQYDASRPPIPDNGTVRREGFIIYRDPPADMQDREGNEE